jgi:hypothetical protein
MGAFEVFFLGTRIFSKIQSSVWPNPAMVAKRCVRAYMEFHGTGNIEQFETTTIDKRHLSRNETESFSKASLKSPKSAMAKSAASFFPGSRKRGNIMRTSAVSFNSAAPGH